MICSRDLSAEADGTSEALIKEYHLFKYRVHLVTLVQTPLNTSTPQCSCMFLISPRQGLEETVLIFESLQRCIQVLRFGFCLDFDHSRHELDARLQWRHFSKPNQTDLEAATLWVIISNWSR